MLAHKIALDPNHVQAMYFTRGCGNARFAHNWSLSESQRQSKAGEWSTESSLRRELNAVKRERFPFLFDVTKCAVQEAIIGP